MAKNIVKYIRTYVQNDRLIQAKATRTAGSNAENQLKRLEPYLGNTEGNLFTLLIELKAQFYKVLAHLMK